MMHMRPFVCIQFITIQKEGREKSSVHNLTDFICNVNTPGMKVFENYRAHSTTLIDVHYETVAHSFHNL